MKEYRVTWFGGLRCKNNLLLAKTDKKALAEAFSEYGEVLSVYYWHKDKMTMIFPKA